MSYTSAVYGERATRTGGTCTEFRVPARFLISTDELGY
jgi:hypothetical protein